MNWVKHNIQKTYETFVNYKCINCGKSLDQLYIELVDSTDMRIWNQWASDPILKTISSDSSVNVQINYVENHHKGCLSEDELMIKDLIE